MSIDDIVRDPHRVEVERSKERKAPDVGRSARQQDEVVGDVLIAAMTNEGQRQ
jgi:hypothetical protein